MLVIILLFLLIFIVIQTNEGRKSLDYINQSINPRELKKERKNLTPMIYFPLLTGSP